VPTLQRKLHLSEEVAQEKCQKCNHKDVDQCVGAIQEGLLLSAHAPIALQHYIHVIDFLVTVHAVSSHHSTPLQSWPANHIAPYLK